MLPPLGKNNIQNTLNECFSMMKEINDTRGFESYINYVYEGFLYLFDNTPYRIAEGYPDYIYKTTDLIKLAGRKYEKKRNEINFFKKHYDASFEKFYPKHIADALLMIDQWKRGKSTNRMFQTTMSHIISTASSMKQRLPNARLSFPRRWDCTGQLLRLMVRSRASR